MPKTTALAQSLKLAHDISRLVTIVKPPFDEAGEHRMDSIHMTLDYRGKGSGRLVVDVFGRSWSHYWSHMGDATLPEFLGDCEVDYLMAKLGRHDEKLRELDATSAKKACQEAILRDRWNGELGRDAARDKWDMVSGVCWSELGDPEIEVLADVLGDWWFERVPEKASADGAQLEAICRNVIAACQRIAEEDSRLADVLTTYYRPMGEEETQDMTAFHVEHWPRSLESVADAPAGWMWQCTQDEGEIYPTLYLCRDGYEDVHRKDWQEGRKRTALTKWDAHRRHVDRFGQAPEERDVPRETAISQTAFLVEEWPVVSNDAVQDSDLALVPNGWKWELAWDRGRDRGLWMIVNMNNPGVQISQQDWKYARRDVNMSRWAAYNVFRKSVREEL